MQTKVRPEPVIPDHEVLRKIGGGAYGEVWLARGVTGAMRAVKTVWYDDFEDERGFEREFEGILKYEPISRSHPGLVHILHVGRGAVDEEPFYYYVMELGDDVVTGLELNTVEYEPRTLRTDMKAVEGAPIEVEDCISVGHLLAEGLEHLHQHGLAHRDVKPSNVIFVDGKAKLADIGLVAQRGQQTFVGTEGFVPPEGPGSAQADVYSLGKVLYEMATGQDRLDFPDPPEIPPEGKNLKRWRLLNSVICDVCEPRITRRKIKTAGELARELKLLELGRPRPIRLTAARVAAVVVAGVGVASAAQFLYWNAWEVSSTLAVSSQVAPAELAPVTVMTYPPNAEVFDAEGNYLGDTPLRTMRLPVGTEVEFRIAKHNYKEMVVAGTVGEQGLVVDPTLVYYKPPEPGEWWEDAFGNRYRPDGDDHESLRYAGADEWKEFQREKKVSFGTIVELSENGEKRKVVLATRGEALQFAKWLDAKCRESYLKDENWIEVRVDRARDLNEVGGGGLPKGAHPFYCVVRREPRTVVSFTSDPPGANVYLNGYLEGRTKSPTAFDPNPEALEISVISGQVQLIIEKEGYKSYEQLLQLKPDDPKWEKPLHIRLEREDIFGEPWVNSLGMNFAPVGRNLMASIWETRVKDYQAFVDASEGKVPAPLRSGFDQDDNHPVVNVSREDAEAFCKWLTGTERAKKLIAANHKYRLPTDLEWSIMAGLRGEVGEWPQERDGERDGYPWGPQWPPPPNAGNFADQDSTAEIGKTIQAYRDGFDKTAPVGSYQDNALGLFDLAGNVQEWVSDDYNADRRHFVARGGDWSSYKQYHLLTSARNIVARKSTDRGTLHGFRVVLAKVLVIPEKETEQVNIP